MADVFLLRCPTGCKSVDVENSCLHQVVVWKSNNIPTIFRCVFFFGGHPKNKKRQKFLVFPANKENQKIKEAAFFESSAFQKNRVEVKVHQ